MSKLVIVTALLAGFSLPAAPLNAEDRIQVLGGTGVASQVDTTVAGSTTSQRNLGSEASPRRWGVQVAGSFSKAEALAAFARVRASYPMIIADRPPDVIAAPLGNRGPGKFYRVRIPAPSHVAAVELCDRIHSAGGSCVVLPMGL
jgi:hypothetical protein